MDRAKAIEILSQYKNHYFGDKTFGGKISIGEVVELLKVQEPVRCKDCDNKECWGRAGDVVCGIDGTSHRPDWFCADGECKEGR